MGDRTNFATPKCKQCRGVLNKKMEPHVNVSCKAGNLGILNSCLTEPRNRTSMGKTGTTAQYARRAAYSLNEPNTIQPNDTY